MSAPDRVAVVSGIDGYPQAPPFHPAEAWPEFPGAVTGPPNAVHAGVRETWRRLGLDRGRFGTAEWNPLRGIVNPGDRVVLKPNLVRHWNGAEDHVRALATHGSVVRAVADYVLLALEGRGTLVIGDAPVQETDFDSVVEQTGIAAVAGWLREHAGGVAVSLVDWRKERAHCLPGGTILRREQLPGDPRGFVEVDLGGASWLAPLADDAERFRVTSYDQGGMRHSHTRERNSYLISGTVLQADVVISLPKMKCHGKAGITCCLKNNVGINGHKDWLPHHREGSVAEGGDEYEHRSLRKRWLTALASRADRATTRAAKKLLYWTAQAIRRTGRVVPCRDPWSEGSWHGNDTAWRMCMDLNRILSFVDAEGGLHEQRQRRFLGLVDGVVAGEGEGPLHPTSKPAGVLVAGSNPAAVDLVCCHLMGFDPGRIGLLRGACDQDARPVLWPGGPQRLEVAATDPRFADPCSLQRAESLAFEPPRGWRGHIEKG